MSSEAAAAAPSTSNGAPQKFHEKDIHLSVDLVDAARKQLVFLKEVDRHKNLYDGPTVKNAIRRYEQIWLPLVAETKAKELAPPLDVHWVWHVHMLAPYFYEKDCLRMVNVVPDHKLMSENSRQAAMENAKKVWEKRCGEPFNLPIDDDVTQCTGYTDQYQSQSKYDLASAISRQRMFYYQVSLPHFQDSNFLKTAILRYKKYLFLKKTFPDQFLVPCYDFDLVWHSHQLHPAVYKKDTTNVLGRMFNHDDSVNDRAPDSKLNRSDVKTRELWKQIFHEDFAQWGTMFRGEPSYGKLDLVSRSQVFQVSSKRASVTLNNLQVENLSQEDQSYTLKVSLAGRQPVGPTVLKLKGPQKQWKNNTKAVSKFVFDTGLHNRLHFDLLDKKRCSCFGKIESFGVHNYPFSQVVEATPAGGQTITQSLPLLEGGTGPANGLNVSFTATVTAPEKGPCILALQASPFQPYTIPENIQQLWGPIPLPTLPPDVPNTCIVASHR